MPTYPYDYRVRERSAKRERRRVDVTLCFSCEVEGEVDAQTVGRELCRLTTTYQFGSSKWIALATDVGLLAATEVGPVAERA